jgi:hypothetical protein
LKEENVASLFCGGGIFDGIHFLISGTAVRGKIVEIIGELGWWAAVLALVVYGLFLYLHKILFGVSPLRCD